MEQNIQKRSGLQTLSLSLDKAIKPIFQKRGVIEYKLITDWKLIVGETLAGYSTPSKVVFPPSTRNNGTLHIDVYDSALALELQYSEPLILEKIAVYFGYSAISRLKLTQKIRHIERLKLTPAKKLKEITIEQQQLLSGQAADITDQELQDIILSLGKAVLQHRED